MQVPGSDVARDIGIQPGFENRDLALFQAVDLAFVLIDTGNVDAEFREARPGHKPDIAGSDHCNAHDESPLRKLP